MKIMKRFCLLMLLVTSGFLLAGCSQSGGTSYPVPSNANAPAATAPAALPNLPYYGAVDRRDCDTVGGWVMHTGNPAADLKVELVVDKKVVETIPAQTVRADLVGKVGTGKYGFSFNIPAALKDGRSHNVMVKVAGTEYTVPFLEGVYPDFECKP